MLPSALSRSDLFRSVHIGRSRFSRCCHLIFDLSLQDWNVGLALDAVTGTRLWAFDFSFLERFCFWFCLLFLRSSCHCPAVAVVQWLVHFSVHP
jgi:hypothetical protein